MRQTDQLAKLIRLMKDLNMKPNYSDLARRYNVDRRTVRRYFESDGIPIRKKKREFSRWDPYEKIVEQKLKIPGMTIRGLHEYFKETLDDGAVPGTYESLKAYIKKKGFTRSSARSRQVSHVHFETEMGQQIQVDWIEDLKLTLKNGEVVEFNIYSATLGYSREHVFIYSPTKTTADFIRCTIEVFRRLGGTTNELITDNMSAVVTTSGKTRCVNPRVSQLFRDLGIKLHLCKPRTPQTKGKDESANRFQSWILPYNDELESEEQVRNLIDEVLTRRTNNKPNETTGIQPALLYQKEKEYLNPLPRKVLLEDYLSEHATRKVPQTLLVSFKGNGYSVPKRYIGSTVHLYVIKEKLYIYDHKGELITIHSITDQKKNYHLDHYMDGLSVRNKTEDEIDRIARENLMRFEQSFSSGK